MRWGVSRVGSSSKCSPPRLVCRRQRNAARSTPARRSPNSLDSSRCRRVRPHGRRALRQLDCNARLHPAEMTWKAGMDVLSFGATKNGALACEAVIFFDLAAPRIPLSAQTRRSHAVERALPRRADVRVPQRRPLARSRPPCQCLAARLEAGVRRFPGVRLPWPRQVNELFVILPRRADAALKAAGARYYDWGARSLSAEKRRRMTRSSCVSSRPFATKRADIDRFVAIVEDRAIAA